MIETLSDAFIQVDKIDSEETTILSAFDKVEKLRIAEETYLGEPKDKIVRSLIVDIEAERIEDKQKLYFATRELDQEKRRLMWFARSEVDRRFE